MPIDVHAIKKLKIAKVFTDHVSQLCTNRGSAHAVCTAGGHHQLARLLGGWCALGDGG